MSISLATLHDHHLLDLGPGESRIDRALVDALHRALDIVDRTDPSLPLITTSQGRHFSNGLNLEWLRSLPHSDIEGFVNELHRLFARVLVLDRLTVAAINGHCVGSGLVLALAHDFRVMCVDRGVLYLPEVDIGLSLTPGMLDLLRAKLSATALRTLAVVGNKLPASDGVCLGIVDDCAPLDRLVESALAHVQSRRHVGGRTLRAMKRAVFGATCGALPGPDGARTSAAA